MAFHRPSPRLAPLQSARPSPESDRNVDLQQTTRPTSPESRVATRDWPSDETALLREVLLCHDLPEAIIERLIGVATAPPHAARLVDRLAVALAAHFHFLPLEDALQTPMLLYGTPGTGVSTLAAKLAARFDEREVLVVSTDSRGAEARAQLEENLDVLGLPLALASDAAALASTVASADGRKVIIDTACGSPADTAHAADIRKLTSAAGAQGMLVLAADASAEDAVAIATAAAQLGTRRMIATRLDTARYIGPVLVAADAGKLALVAASVTPHFAFGLRVLTPENLARRLMSAALPAERWRVAPL